jgi:hypothetical protein
VDLPLNTGTDLREGCPLRRRAEALEAQAVARRGAIPVEIHNRVAVGLPSRKYERVIAPVAGEKVAARIVASSIPISAARRRQSPCNFRLSWHDI